jgi:hypothetical protein
MHNDSPTTEAYFSKQHCGLEEWCVQGYQRNEVCIATDEIRYLETERMVSSMAGVAKDTHMSEVEPTFSRY